MNNISDYDAHKRDEEFDAEEDRKAEIRERVRMGDWTTHQFHVHPSPNCHLCRVTEDHNA